jgi:hypothetical protein
MARSMGGGGRQDGTVAGVGWARRLSFSGS